MSRNRSISPSITFVLVAALVAAAPTSEPEWQRTTGGWVSGDVAYVDTIATEVGGAVDAVLHEDLLYLTSWRSFSIYDVGDPLAPERLSHVVLGPSLWNEAPQTNGEILLISRDLQYLPPTDELPRGGGVLEIYDVSDPRNPTLLSTYESEITGFFRSQRDHLWTCVLACRFAYSAGGTVVDLSDPANPVRVGRWTDVAPFEAMHYVGEVAPGIVMTGSLPVYVLDARQNAVEPTVLATFWPDHDPTSPLVADPVAVANPVANPTSLPGRVDWPGALKGRLAVVTMETPFTGNCTDVSGGVQTFVTSGWRGSGTFKAADSYQLTSNGTYDDGAPPANVLGCSAYGLDVHDSFGRAGGRVAVAFFEHGVRLLDIDAKGTISEHGGFVPLAGNSSRPLWVNDEVLYSVDAQRGVDILHVDAAS